MALQLSVKTDAELAAPLIASGDIGDSWYVGLDETRTLAVFPEFDAAATTIPGAPDERWSLAAAVLEHPDGGGGAWGSKVQVGATGDNEARVCFLSTDKVLIAGWDGSAGAPPEFFAQVLTVSGTTITPGTRYSVADHLIIESNPFALIGLSADLALLFVDPYWHGVVINISGSTIISHEGFGLNSNPELITTTEARTFESSDGGWTTGNATTTIVGSSSDISAIDGSKTLKVQQVGSGLTFIRSPIFSGITAGESYDVLLYFYSSSGGTSDDVDVDLEWYDASNTLLSTSNCAGRPIEVYNQGIATLTGYAVAPANATKFAVRVTVSNVTNAYTWYIDAVSVRSREGQITFIQSVKALDSSRVLMVYWGGDTAPGNDTEEIWARILTVTSSSVTNGTPVLLHQEAGMTVIFPSFGRQIFNIFSLLGYEIAIVPMFDAAFDFHFLQFRLAISGTTISAIEDATVLTCRNQGDWGIIFDNFVIHFESPTGSMGDTTLYFVYRIDSDGFITGLDLNTAPNLADLPHPSYGGGRPTFVGQNRMVVIAPHETDGASPTLRGTEFQIIGLPCLAPRLVAVGQDNDTVYTNNGIDWLDDGMESIGSTLSWRVIMWTGTEFRAAGFFGDYAKSSDGLSWTNLEPSTSGAWGESVNDLIYIRELSLWVAGGEGGEHIKTSSDGLAWTLRESSAAALRGLAWSPAVGIIVAAATSNQLRTSPDGVTWTSRTSGFAVGTNINSVIWIPDLGIFLIVGGNGAYATSSDGITWSASTLAHFGTDDIWGAAYSPTLNLIVIAGEGGKIMTSPDGSAWTARTSPFGSIRIADAYWSLGLSLFAIVDGDDGEVATSYDGITWTIRSSSMPDGLNSVVEGLVPCPETGEWVLGFSAID